MQLQSMQTGTCILLIYQAFKNMKLTKMPKPFCVPCRNILWGLNGMSVMKKKIKN